MARVSKAATKPAPAPEPEVDEDEFPLAHLLDKDPSEVHNRFVEWINDQTGEDVADPKTVQLVISQWQKFQKTPEQQAYTAERKAESAKNAEAREAAREARESAPKTEKVTRSRTASAKAGEDDGEAPARPGRARRGAVVTPPPAKRTSGRRRPAPAAAEVD